MEEKEAVFISRDIEESSIGADKEIDAAHRGLYFERDRHSYYGKKYSRRKTEKGKRHFGARVAICIAIAATLFGMKLIDTPFTRQVIAYVDDTLDYDIDFTEPFGQLDFVRNIFPNAAAVFGNNSTIEYMQPLKGSDISMENRDSGIVFSTAVKNAAVIACADGRVIKRGISDDKGNYIRIVQTDGNQVAYYGLSSSELDEGDLVKRGEAVGVLSGQTLYIEILKNGVAQKPADFFVINK